MRPTDHTTHALRLELGIQLAVAGAVAESTGILRVLAEDQHDYLGPHHPDLTVTLDALAAA